MHARGKLHVRQIAGLTKPGVYSDGGGLYLRVRRTGSRSWLFICMINGKRREMGLGSLLDVSLGQARAKALEARQLFLEGRDPIEERRESKSIAATTTVLFGPFTEALIDDIESGFRNEKHRKQWRSTLRTHAARLFSKPVDEIQTEDVVEVLRPIWLELPETASRVRGRIERVLDAAKAKGHRSGENPARWRGHLDLLLPRRPKVSVEHHAALPFIELAAFMGELRRRPAIAARALEFTILTAARSGEVLDATWGEVDLRAAIWTVPGERMKAGREHQVPLSEVALSLLNCLAKESRSASDRIFTNTDGHKLSNMAMSMVLRRMKCRNVTVHGFRSTFRDWAGERTDFPREVVEMALAHAIESKTERAYRRGRALEKRRLLMEDWASYCAQLRRG
ncbi:MULTISPECIES: tyrosine-type recombinase/integrase [Stakelama]|mgnify:CR=1 FL=1|uniref:Tyrosine-type recombinase/integrase n=3 Tax=Stakelama TaxID=1124625 RepID=A0A8T4IH44_9SPHN|nr:MULTISPECIES: site-specific integrase [Stakelama]MAW99499.1 integrase [Sphingomonas sp.]MBR0553907.1 tyrosine-type recombinase/integrase [Stakelama marina]TDN85358.1 integrase [Stakelama pacifica]WNO53532.1 tyrosine-type recombinase/integrase [Stakelama sp. W311]